MTAAHTPVAVIGAGLTGLSTAFHLDRAGVGRRLFERSDHVGGHAVTVEDSGYRFDRTGHLLHLRDAEMRALALGWIGPGAIEIQRRSRIWSSGVYTRYPFQANTFGLPPEVANACLLGFLKAHFAADKREPQNFEEFCRATFGDGISEHFMVPYNTRLWGVSPRDITAEWCQRFVPIPRLEDVVAGAVGLNDRELGYNASFVYPRLGIGQLTEGLARATGRVELSRAPVAIDVAKRELHFDDEIVGYDALVSTAPLPSLVRLCRDAPRDVIDAAAKLRATHLYYLDVALHTPCEKDLHWVYVPEAKYPFYRVGCYSNFSAAMAPPGKACLYVELASREEPDLAELLPRVAAGLVEMGLIRAPEAIRFARVRRLDPVYVIFDRDHAPALDVVRRYLGEHDVVSAGRYGGWNYSGMEDALLFGRAAAREAQVIAARRAAERGHGAA